MARVTATQSSTAAPLVVCTIVPIGGMNQGVRGSWVQVSHPTTQGLLTATGFRLGTRHLLVSDNRLSWRYKGAVRDQHGVWSELSAPTAPKQDPPSPFTPGATEGSIGSGATADWDIQDPGVSFPDPAQGSSKMRVHRTLVGGGFLDEQRLPQWHRPRAAFRITFDLLDPEDAKRLRRLWRAVNGPRDPFFFYWAPPELGTRTTTPSQRFVVRFRDASLGDRLFGTDQTELTLSLIEVQDDPFGGDV